MRVLVERVEVSVLSAYGEHGLGFYVSCPGGVSAYSPNYDVALASVQFQLDQWAGKFGAPVRFVVVAKP